MLKTTQASTLMKNIGLCFTANRTRVLGFLLDQNKALTHREIDQGLSVGKPIDHVTLYRVLDWLLEAGLVHRVGGDGHVSRFRAGHNDQLHPHAHFQCASCSTISCMEQHGFQKSVSLPKGFLLMQAEFLLKGLCPACH